MKIKKIVLFFLFLTINAFPNTLKTNDIIPLKKVIVKSTVKHYKKPESINNSKIKDFQLQNITDALQLITGINYGFNGVRNEKTFNIRGQDIKHTAIFIDNIPIYTPYDGNPDIERYPSFYFSKIEVHKNYNSILYGLNTYAGIINLVTKSPKNNLELELDTGVSFDAEIRANNYYSHFYFGSKINKLYFLVTGSLLKSDYYSLSDDFKPTVEENGDKRENSYKKNKLITVKCGYKPNHNDDYFINFIHQKANKGIPPYSGSSTNMKIRFWQNPVWNKSIIYFNAKKIFHNNNYFKARIYYNKFDNAIFSYDDNSYSTMTFGYTFKSWYDDFSTGTSLEYGININKHNILKFAAHFKLNSHKEHNEGEPVREFKNLMLSFGIEESIYITEKIRFSCGAAINYLNSIKAEDYYKSTSTISNFNLYDSTAIDLQTGLFYKINKHNKLNFIIEKKTRMPSLKDRYSYRLGYALPNENLSPEKILNFEIEHKIKLVKKISIKNSVFIKYSYDYIQSVTIISNIEQNQNTGKIKFYGYEIEGNLKIGKNVLFNLNYAYLYPDNSSNIKLIDISKHNLSGFIQIDFLKRLKIIINSQFSSSRYSSSDGLRIAEKYFINDLKFSVIAIKKHLKVNFGINNIFDKNYEIEEGYPLSGRNYYFNINFKY